MENYNEGLKLYNIMKQLKTLKDIPSHFDEYVDIYKRQLDKYKMAIDEGKNDIELKAMEKQLGEELLHIGIKQLEKKFS